jgi:hypothetical protein
MSETESFTGKSLNFPGISEKLILLKSPISDVDGEIFWLPVSLPLNRPSKYGFSRPRMYESCEPKEK